MSISISTKYSTVKIYLSGKKPVEFEMGYKTHASTLRKFFCQTLKKDLDKPIIMSRNGCNGISFDREPRVEFASMEGRERFMAFIKEANIPNLTVEASPEFYNEGLFVIFNSSSMQTHKFAMQSKSCAMNLVHLMNNRGDSPIFSEGEVTIMIDNERVGFAGPAVREAFLSIFRPSEIWYRRGPKVKVHPRYRSHGGGVISSDIVFEMYDDTYAAEMVRLLNDPNTPKVVDYCPQGSKVDNRVLGLGNKRFVFDTSVQRQLFLNTLKPQTHPSAMVEPTLAGARLGDKVELEDGRILPITSVNKEKIEVQISGYYLEFHKDNNLPVLNQREREMFGSNVLRVKKLVREFNPKPGDIFEGSDGHHYVIDDFPNGRIAVFDRQTDEHLFFSADGTHPRLNVRLVKRIK